MPSYAHTIEVAASPSAAFAVIDDFSKTPQWLQSCTQLDKIGDEPNAVGTRLVYHYKVGSRLGRMDGHIAVREPDRRLVMTFKDRLMDVTVDFATTPTAAEDTSLTHSISINPKGLGKVFGPVIGRHLPDQTIDALSTLKAMVEEG